MFSWKHDRQNSILWTVQLNSYGPSTLTKGGSLWTGPKMSSLGYQINQRLNFKWKNTHAYFQSLRSSWTKSNPSSFRSFDPFPKSWIFTKLRKNGRGIHQEGKSWIFEIFVKFGDFFPEFSWFLARFCNFTFLSKVKSGNIKRLNDKKPFKWA